MARTLIVSVHQTGPGYRSNNAGDGPEKTRDRKSWFPRFKSNWLGTFRSKQMFHCCECAVTGSSSGGEGSSPQAATGQSIANGMRYKGAEGKHCLCGRDQWHLAKAIEETEYNRRMEISKALGGMRYDEAAARLRALGIPETDLDRIRETFAAGAISLPASHASSLHASSEPRQARAKRARAVSASVVVGSSRLADVYDSPLSSASTVSSTSPSSISMTSAPMAVSYSHYYQHQEFPQHHNKDFSSSYMNVAGSYSPLHSDYAHTNGHGMSGNIYDHYVTAAFTDEEGFGELLQGILEDDAMAPRQQAQGYAPTRHSLPMQQPMAPRMNSYSSFENSASMRSAQAFKNESMHDSEQAYYSGFQARSGGHYGGVMSPTASSRYQHELQPFAASRSYVAAPSPAAFSTVV